MAQHKNEPQQNIDLHENKLVLERSQNESYSAYKCGYIKIINDLEEELSNILESEKMIRLNKKSREPFENPVSLVS
jgi:hypothetical protein